jgi:hypothetical protein
MKEIIIMGAFSELWAVKTPPQPKKKINLKGGEIISVKKYGWSIIQKVLCSQGTKVIEIDRGVEYLDNSKDELYLAVIVADAQKGIKYFSEFMPELNKQIDIDNFEKNFDAAMRYFKQYVKQRFFVFDSTEMYGMNSDDNPQHWKREIYDIAKECVETRNGAKWMVYNSNIKNWLASNYSGSDIGFDLSWISNVSDKRVWNKEAR